MTNSNIEKKQYVNFSLVLVILFWLTSACSSSEGSQNGDARSENNIPAVEAVKARFGSLPLSERLSGTVIAKNQVELYPEISGKIAEVLVENGQQVTKGEALVNIEDAQYQEQVQQAEAGLKISKAQLKQARASFNELQSQYRRTKTLSEKELSSDLELEQLEAQMESAQADVELAEAGLPIRHVRALIEVDRLGEGEGHAQDLSNLRIEVVLTENMLNDIEVGQTAKIYAGSGEDNVDIITAELARISPFLNTVTRSTEAEIDVQNQKSKLRPGMFVAVDILYGESEQATVIPTSALYTDPNSGQEGVFVATSLGSEVEAVEDTSSDGPASMTQPIDVQFKPIEVIAEGRMELGVSGIEPGSWIVTIGQDLLSQGRNQARVRTSTWERILTLQGLQRQDLLNRVLDQQKSSQSTL